MTGFGIMTVIGGRISGKLVAKIGARKTLSLGLITAVLADLVIYLYGNIPVFMVIGIVLLGLGFIFTHSTLLTRITEFAHKERGAAMSLIAFCFMGGGGVGKALAGRIVSAAGLNNLFMIYSIALAITLLLSFILIHGQVVVTNKTG
jgi:predicted MFS family arabinose efflux permease